MVVVVAAAAAVVVVVVVVVVFHRTRARTHAGLCDSGRVASRGSVSF